MKCSLYFYRITDYQLPPKCIESSNEANKNIFTVLDSVMVWREHTVSHQFRDYGDAVSFTQWRSNQVLWLRIFHQILYWGLLILGWRTGGTGCFPHLRFIFSTLQPSTSTMTPVSKHKLVQWADVLRYVIVDSFFFYVRECAVSMLLSYVVQLIRAISLLNAFGNSYLWKKIKLLAYCFRLLCLPSVVSFAPSFSSFSHWDHRESTSSMNGLIFQRVFENLS